MIYICFYFLLILNHLSVEKKKQAWEKINRLNNCLYFPDFQLY